MGKEWYKKTAAERNNKLEMQLSKGWSMWKGYVKGSI